MCNIYVTSEPEQKLRQVFSNLKNFFILDTCVFVKELGIDLQKPSGVYLANTEIEKAILSQAKLKKYHGVVYINKKLSKHLLDYLEKRFAHQPEIGKIVLIDNGQFPEHADIMNDFDEVMFFERFKKSKITEYAQFSPHTETKLADADMFIDLLSGGDATINN